jgi:hypothetical protein
VQRLLTYVVAFRSSGIRVSPELGPVDLAAMNLLYELGEIAAPAATSAAASSADRPDRHDHDEDRVDPYGRPRRSTWSEPSCLASSAV